MGPRPRAELAATLLPEIPTGDLRVSTAAPDRAAATAAWAAHELARVTRESAEVDRERAARWQGKRRRERQAQLDRRIEAVRRGEVYVPDPAAVPVYVSATACLSPHPSVSYPGGATMYA